MVEISQTVLVNLLFFLTFPFVGAYLAIKFKLPAILGYILGGVFLSVFLGSRLSTDFLSHFANIGIILLLFTVGLEVDLTFIRRFGKYVVLGAGFQIIISILLIFFLSLAFKFQFLEALIIGSAFAFSSTAVVVKIIQDRGEENSFLGALTIGILVFQDLVAIPLIIIFSTPQEGASGLIVLKNIIFALIKSIFIMLLIFLAGKNIVPFIFNKVARRSRELLNLFAILFIFCVVYLASILGLSAPIAAFIAGILVGQTLQNVHIFSQIRPFRDLFAILFFVFLGASVNPAVLISRFPQILLFAAILILLKLFVVMVIFILLKFHSRASFTLGVYLSQIGEFAFIIMYQGLLRHTISYETYEFVIPAVLISIALTPILISQKDKIYAQIRNFIRKRLPVLENYINYKIDRDQSPIDSLNIKDHVVICGFGVVGSYIGRALMMANIPFVAVDYNFATVEKAKKQGVAIIYGDPTDINILDYVQVDTAMAIVLAMPEKFSQETIILMAKKLNKKITIFSRIGREGDQRRMKDLGAEVVIQPEFEAALSIIKKILGGFNLPKEDIVGKIKRLKIEHGMA